MNDRYLYRAKRKNWRELPKEMWWVEGYLYGIWERRYILWGMTNDVPNMVEVDPSTICQCTGLKDKNGNLVWENDVVRIKYDDDFSEVGWIKYSNCGVRYNFVFGTEIYSIDDSCDIEVIGKIFYNPELMNE